MEFMAKLRSGETDINSYRIKGTENIIRVGDCVLIRPLDARKPKYVACVEKFEKDNNNNVNVHVRWYYRPEEAFGGRRIFHGANELFLTDHYDVKSADVIEGKCFVYPFNDYTKIENPGAKDFYCRFEYKVDTQVFTPDDVQVYCICEIPYNPDIFMVQCLRCRDRYHLACVGLTIEKAKAMNQYLCSDCFSKCKEEVGENNLNNFTDEEHNGNAKKPTQVPTELETSTQNSVTDIIKEPVMDSCTRMMNVLNNIDGLECGSTLWLEALQLLEDPVRREMFLAMKNDAARLAWIKLKCNIKDN